MAEVIGVAAASLQLFSEAISVVQQIYEVQDAVRTAPKVLEDTKSQVTSLVDTVEEVWHEPDLHTPAIHDQIVQIYSITRELVRILESMEALQRRSKFYQSFRMWIKKERDAARLEDILVRLERAKIDLSVRIQATHVGMTSNMALGVQRIEKEMRTAARSERRRHTFRLEGNKAAENSKQLNGILGLENTGVTTIASVRENTSIGNSRQNNLILAGPPPHAFLQSLELV